MHPQPQGKRKVKRVPLAELSPAQLMRGARQAMRQEASPEEQWRILTIALDPGDLVAMVYE